ncbi:transketolase [Candidatus Uhrbacteria bacterium]|nr:transketolase [Candidatus Uhrbacteria bacterium]
MSDIHDKKVIELEKIATEIRIDLIKMLVEAKSGHTAGPLDLADLYTALYFHILQHDPKNPDWPERDRLILSCGHTVPIRYVTMAHAGYFSKDLLKTLRQFGSPLQGHPERTKLAGMETTSGPLGSGLSQAGGMAYAARMDGRKFRIYCLMSDGEQDCGNTWEGAMFAGKYKLNNLTAFIDRNNIQIDGVTEKIMPLEPLGDKYRAFGWNVIDIDGHNIREIVDAVEQAKAVFEKPTLIVAHTIPGKGIHEIEFDYKWHGIPPKPEEGKRFIHELRTLGGQIKSEHQ